MSATMLSTRKEVSTMANEKMFIDSYEDFMVMHPEYLPEWKEYVEPVVVAEDDSLFGFIFGYLLV